MGYVIEQRKGKIVTKWNGRTRRLRFLIRWKGYSASEDSWEDDGDVHASEKVLQFYWRYPTADRRPTSPIERRRNHRGHSQVYAQWQGVNPPEAGWVDEALVIPTGTPRLTALLLDAPLEGGNVRNVRQIPDICAASAAHLPQSDTGE